MNVILGRFLTFLFVLSKIRISFLEQNPVSIVTLYSVKYFLMYSYLIAGVRILDVYNTWPVYSEKHKDIITSNRLELIIVLSSSYLIRNIMYISIAVLCSNK